MTGWRRVLGAIAALMVAGAVVIGGPWALIRFGRLAAFTGLDWPGLFTTADDGSLVLGVITVVGWLAWALATLSLLSELLATLSHHRWQIRIPGTSVFAPASSVLVTAIVGLVASQVVTPAVAHASPSQPPAPQPAATSVGEDAAQEQQGTERSTPGRSHLVQPGDDLWTLAERYYQDGSRWREIAPRLCAVAVNRPPGTRDAVGDPEPAGRRRRPGRQPGDTRPAWRRTTLRPGRWGDRR